MAWELIVNEKMNQEFKGHAEMCTYTFSLGPEQVPGMRWAAQQVTNAHVAELQKENSTILELRVWEDASPTWQTDYYVEIVASASPLWWNIIIAGALILLIGLAILFTIIEVKDIVEYIGEHAPGSIPLMFIAVIGATVLIGVILLSRRSPAQVRYNQLQGGN